MSDPSLDLRCAQTRVAAYNLRALLDNPQAAARVVRAIDPDVLLVQEIPRGLRSAGSIEVFAAEAGMRWPGRTRRVSGTSLLVGRRVEVHTRRDRALPVEFLGNPRTYSWALVRVAGGQPFAAVSIHLPLRANRRRQHVGQLLSELTVHPMLGDVPWVIGGDLNEHQGDPAWQILAGEVPLASTAGVRTFPAIRPKTAIDAVFASSTLRAKPGIEVDLDLADLTAATDHRPVWVDLLT